jgi:hypothetical protein
MRSKPQEKEIRSFYEYVEKPFGSVDGEKRTIGGIRLLQPAKWEGYVFYFNGGKIGGKPDSEGKVAITYDFETLENPTNISKEDMEGSEFGNLLGDIFLDIVAQITEDGDYELLSDPK